jgi:hypothetical protein
MKALIDRQRPLKELEVYVRCKSSGIAEELAKRQGRKKAPSSTDDASLTPEQISFQKTHAAKTIIHAWRGRKIKEKLAKNPYASYLSLIDPSDEQHALSAMMFGRHVAELHIDKIANPYIDSKAFYHRVDSFSGTLLTTLLSQFNIPNETHLYEYIPITPLRNMPIEKLLGHYFPHPSTMPKLYRRKDHSIILLAIPKSHAQLAQVKNVVRAAGLVASPWEIAANIKVKRVAAVEDDNKISLDPHLPKTKEALLRSKIMGKLNFIASDPRHPTQKLAESLRRMLRDLPELSPEAIQRIALMLDMTNTFYEHHYQRYAFCVYAIVHEISLALLKKADTDTLDREYKDFLTESEETLLSALGLQKERLDNLSFIAAPAMSGTNAYALAMQLATKMQTRGAKPTIQVIKPAYYEFGYITEQTHDIEPDIFSISCGPIVNLEGLTPGVDINLFVKRHIIDRHRTKPATIIIDATTTLYKNLTLTPEVKALVETGKLSIIVHESHQKFGLLHTDQAQYGRMFGLCAKGSYADEALRSIQDHSKLDFGDHLDLRIGAFISKSCKTMLEDIKQQHFTNGALLRNILTRASLVERDIVSHKDMLTNLDELYFLTSSYSQDLIGRAHGIAERRDSFGHYAPVTASVGFRYRLSPDATDRVDCLIQAAQIYLAKHYSPKDLVEMVIEGSRNQQSLSLEDQIISIAMLNRILLHRDQLPDNINHLELFAAFDNILNHCPLLEGRQYFLKPKQYLIELRESIKKEYHPQKSKIFFEAIHFLHDKNITPTHLGSLSNPRLIHYMKTNATLSELNYKAAAVIAEVIPECTDFFSMLKNKNICKAIIRLYDDNQKILFRLKGSKKHDKAVAHTPQYLRDCLVALKTFSAIKAPKDENKDELIQSLNTAKNTYCTTILAKDRDNVSKATRIMLMVLTNFIASLTLGIAHYSHYKATGNKFFFAETTSALTLRARHKKLADDLRQLRQSENEEDPKSTPNS